MSSEEEVLWLAENETKIGHVNKNRIQSCKTKGGREKKKNEEIRKSRLVTVSDYIFL